MHSLLPSPHPDQPKEGHGLIPISRKQDDLWSIPLMEDTEQAWLPSLQLQILEDCLREPQPVHSLGMQTAVALILLVYGPLPDEQCCPAEGGMTFVPFLV